MKEYTRQEKLMGSVFTLGLISDDQDQALHWLQAGVDEIVRIELLLSEFLNESVTSSINRSCGKEVQIDKETFQLLERSVAISSLSSGDFDITVRPLKKLYQFKNRNFNMPDQSAISRSLQCVGYEKIMLEKDTTTVRLQHPDMQVSFSAIGKGYASDCVKKLWISNGIRSGYINASGDLNVFGKKADGSDWKVGILNPDQKDKMLFYIPLQDASVATSGDYEQHFLWNGRRYSHNINPHTGYPVTGIKSVTVISPGAELSDALATAVYVKGERKGIRFIDQLPGTHCIIVTDQNKIYFSKKLRYEKADI